MSESSRLSINERKLVVLLIYREIILNYGLPLAVIDIVIENKNVK